MQEYTEEELLDLINTQKYFKEDSRKIIIDHIKYFFKTLIEYKEIRNNMLDEWKENNIINFTIKTNKFKKEIDIIIIKLDFIILENNKKLDFIIKRSRLTDIDFTEILVFKVINDIYNKKVYQGEIKCKTNIKN